MYYFGLTLVGDLIFCSSRCGDSTRYLNIHGDSMIHGVSYIRINPFACTVDAVGVDAVGFVFVYRFSDHS